jgi:hypothetical protein
MPASIEAGIATSLVHPAVRAKAFPLPLMIYDLLTRSLSISKNRFLWLRSWAGCTLKHV